MRTSGAQAAAMGGDVLTGAAAGEALAGFVESHRNLFVLTGAGCSTDSGIPDYRDDAGAWKRQRPMQWREFAGSAHGRRRYWARSLVGWARVHAARPSGAHQALAGLEGAGRIHTVVTQNVDGLHQQAGSRRVIDLHGRLDRVECMDCGGVMERSAYQDHLADLNPGWATTVPSGHAPDGDADLDGADYGAFRVPDCHGCGGIIRPSVVFFGESVPAARVATAMARLAESDAVLVAGSSLMVWSGLRFVRAAAERGLPCAAVNLGRTRADGELVFRAAVPCGPALGEAAARFEGRIAG